MRLFRRSKPNQSTRWGATTEHNYDADGNVVTTTNPDGTGVTQNYNINGEVCNKMPVLVQYPCGQGPECRRSHAVRVQRRQ